MIKINLLAVDREKTKRKAKFQIGEKATAASSLILVLAALFIGWWYWSLTTYSADLDRQIADAEAERARLQSIIQQVQQFEGRRAQLQQRVTLIEQLRKGQTGPVHLVDEVSRALPDAMWLTEMKQTGNDVLIEGRGTSLTALSDFVSALEASNVFERPVEIIDSSVENAVSAAMPSSTDLIRFSVKGKFVAPTN